MDQRACNDFEVGAFHRRAQIGACRTLPAPPAAGLLHPADAVAGAGRQMVDIVAVFEPELLARLDHHLAQRWLVGGARGEERPARAVKCVAAAFPILGLLEIGQYIVPRPAAVAELAPMVEILRLAADIDHAVDRAGAAEHPAARIEDGPAVDTGVGLGRVAPGQHRMVEQFHIAGRNVNQRVAVARPRLDQQHPGRRVLAQPVGQNAPRRPGADDDVIRFHACSPSPVIASEAKQSRAGMPSSHRDCFVACGSSQ